METETQISNANCGDILEYSQEFKEEMESSICNYFNKCHLNDDQQLNKSKELIRDNTLIDNENQNVEYISPVPSLKGISDFMIHQVFSTERIVPIDDSSDEESIQQTNGKENDSTTPTNMNTCNSDETLNEEVAEILRTPEKTEAENENENENTKNINPEHDTTISESFATEFINLLDINMKELNNKKDDFHVIGLKRIEEEKEVPSETPEVKIKEEFLGMNSKTTLKRSKHNSVLFSLGRRCSTSNLRLFRSKSTDFKSSSNKKQNKDASPVDSLEGDDNKLKRSKSKSRLSLSRLFKNVKKRISSHNLTTSKKQ